MERPPPNGPGGPTDETMPSMLRSGPGALVSAILLVVLPATPAAAAAVYIPAGTPIGLKFLTPVDSRQTTVGSRVRFRVVAGIGQGHSTLVRSGTTVIGTVTEVTRPGAFGASARVVIGFLSVNAVDGKSLKLNDVVISKDMVSKSRVGAAGTSMVGAMILGPVGLLAGALIRGNDVEVPRGVVVTDTVRNSATVRAT
jgi:hypothetical protein